MTTIARSHLSAEHHATQQAHPRAHQKTVQEVQEAHAVSRTERLSATNRIESPARTLAAAGALEVARAPQAHGANALTNVKASGLSEKLREGETRTNFAQTLADARKATESTRVTLSPEALAAIQAGSPELIGAVAHSVTTKAVRATTRSQEVVIHLQSQDAPGVAVSVAIDPDEASTVQLEHLANAADKLSFLEGASTVPRSRKVLTGVTTAYALAAYQVTEALGASPSLALSQQPHEISISV